MSYIKYRYKNFIILAFPNESKGYIVYNKSKPFDQGHTHVKFYRVAKYIAHCAYNLEIDEKMCKRTIVSLLRITNKKSYIYKLELRLKELEKLEKNSTELEELDIVSVAV